MQHLSYIRDALGIRRLTTLRPPEAQIGGTRPSKPNFGTVSSIILQSFWGQHSGPSELTDAWLSGGVKGQRHEAEAFEISECVHAVFASTVCSERTEASATS